jgi:hypothetical protein
MNSVIFGADNSAPSTSATNYNHLTANFPSSWNSTQATRTTVIPVAVDLSNFYFEIDTQPGVGKSFAFTIMKNGVATALTVTISGTNTSAIDNTHTVSFAAGDTVALQCVPSTTPAASTNHYWTLNAAPTGGNNQPIVVGTTTAPSTSASNYANLHGSGSSGAMWSATETDKSFPMPTAGSFTNLYINLQTAPASGKSWTYTLMVNGSPSALTATVSNTATTANDTTHTVNVSVGDLVSLQITPSGTPTAAGTHGFGLSFNPTTAGESIFSFASVNANSVAAVNYEQPLGLGNNGWSATENIRYIEFGPYHLTKMYASVITAPGIGKSWTFTMRQNGVDTAVTAVISDTATTATGTGNVTYANGDKAAIESTPSSTPAASGGVHIGYVLTDGSGGGTAYTQSVNATFSSSGVLTKLTSRTHTASFSATGLFTWLFARLFTANFSGVGNINKAVTKSAFTAQFSSTGSLNKQQQRTLTATFSTVGQLIGRAATRLLTATFSSSGLLNRRAARTLTASHSAAGTLTKQTNKTPFTATFSSSGVVSGAHGVAKLLTATYITTGQLTNRTLTRALTATYSTAGSLVRLFSRPLAGTFSTSGSLSRSTGIAPFVATLVASGVLSRLPGKSLSGTYSASGQLTKQPRKSFTATFSSAGNLVKSLARALAGVFSGSGSLAGVKIGGHNQSFTATFSTAGNITNRSIGRQHTATYQTSGNLNKTTARNLTATASTAGNLVGNKIMHKVLTATFSASGTLVRTAGKLFTASYRTLGSLLSTILPGPIKLPAHWTHVDTGNPTAYTPIAKNGTQWQQRDDGADTAWKQTGGDKS